MKLDDLIAHDSTTFYDGEWILFLQQGPLQGNLIADLEEGHWQPDGNAFMRFSFTAPREVVLMGFTCIRSWAEDGSLKIRTVRQDVWTPAYVMQTGAVISFDLIIEPAEWA